MFDLSFKYVFLLISYRFQFVLIILKIYGNLIFVSILDRRVEPKTGYLNRLSCDAMIKTLMETGERELTLLTWGQSPNSPTQKGFLLVWCRNFPQIEGCFVSKHQSRHANHVFGTPPLFLQDVGSRVARDSFPRPLKFLLRVFLFMFFCFPIKYILHNSRLLYKNVGTINVKEN